MSGPGVTLSSNPARMKSPRSCVPSIRYPSGEGHELRIVLPGALEAQEIVITAAARLGVLAAGARTSVVDGAAAGFLVEHHAGRVEDRVLPMAQHADSLGGIGLGEARFGDP